MVRATIELAHQIGLTIVAEGVETEAALEVLRARLRLGARLSAAPPAPGADVTEQLRAHAPIPA